MCANQSPNGSVNISEKQKGIFAVVFSGAKANSLTGELLQKLAAAIESVSTNQTAKVILIESEGEGAFCGGASFEEMKQLSSFSEAKQFFLGFAKVILAMVRSQIPVILVVQGKSVGGALGVIAAADYVVAAKSSAEVKLSELSIGIGPYVISAPLIRKIGIAKFSELTLGLEWRDAQWAAQAGLFSELAEDIAGARSSALLKAETLANVSRNALISAKQMLTSDTKGWEKELDQLAESSANLLMAQKY